MAHNNCFWSLRTCVVQYLFSLDLSPGFRSQQPFHLVDKVKRFARLAVAPPRLVLLQ